MFQKTDFIRN